MEKYQELMARIDKDRVPKHIAVIMDGNGRWAKKRLQNRLYGHKHGAEAVRRTIEGCHEVGVKYLTLYTFSTENWSRPKSEITGLFKLIINTLFKEFDDLIKNNVRLKFIGSRKELDSNFIEQIDKACARSAANDGLTVLIAINYGSRREILDAVNDIVSDKINGKLDTKEISEELFSSYLYTDGVPDPELLIRTSGEMRLSNYLLWQNAYTEFWFTEKLWPDFKKEHLMQAIIDYQNRDRRFGAV
ncbi:isoprenyl transferase [bacterium]|nr:isoprenyl transferase [bacterium]